MSLISILDKVESKILELEDKKEEIQQQIRDMSALEYSIQDKINETAEDIAETRRNIDYTNQHYSCLLYTSPSPRDS